MVGDSSANYTRLTRLADEFAARYRRGERPALKEYIDLYPDLADDIRDLFPAMVEMEQAKEDHRAADQPPASLPADGLPPRQLGDFRIIREIGRGGMGVVFEAEQISLRRHVALKVLPQKKQADPKHKGRFEREARAAAKLHHTNIVPVFGVGEHEGTPYYAMQFIQGLGLDEVLEELVRLREGGSQAGKSSAGGELRVSRRDVSAADVARSLLTGQLQPTADATVDRSSVEKDEASPPADTAPTGRLSDSFSLSGSSLPGRGADRAAPQMRKLTYCQSVANMGGQIAAALEYAHKQGVLHRDIKPSNLLLDTGGTVWVSDFGLAKADDQQNLTETGDILGTLRYMPPEALEGRTDTRSDIYALGLTLYELLAFRPAFGEKERPKLISGR